MKRFLILLGVVLLGTSAANAQLNLSSAFNKLKEVASETTEKMQSKEDGSEENTGNSIVEGLSKLMDSIIPKAEIPGTWSYVGLAIEFTSNNSLSNAGGSIAAAAVEEKLAPTLENAGIKPGLFNFTFNEDGTLQTSLGKKELKGTWKYDEKAEVVTVTILTKEYTTRMTVNGENINILFEADKLLELVKSLSSKSEYATLNTISTLVKAYDGMNIGFECERVK